MQEDAEQPVLLESQTQWQICHLLCFAVNANQTAQCWAVMTAGGMRMMGLMPPSWSLFLPVWKFYWHRFCGVPTVHSYGYAQFSSLNGLYPPHSFNSTYGCTILLGVVLPVKPEWAEGNVSSNRLWQHFQKAKLEKNLSGKLSRNKAVKPPLASCFFFWVVFLLSLHCICSHFYFHQAGEMDSQFCMLSSLDRLTLLKLKLLCFILWWSSVTLFFSCYYVLTHFNKSEHTSVLIHLTNTAYKLCWICSVLKLHYCLFMMHFSYLQQRRHCNDFCWQPRENCI